MKTAGRLASIRRGVTTIRKKMSPPAPHTCSCGTGTQWTQQAFLKSSNIGPNDWFGSRSALSGDGNTAALGASLEDSSGKGINGKQDDDAAPESGAVCVFTRTGTTWSQQHYVKSSNAEAYDEFGGSVALSRDGRTMVAAARGGWRVERRCRQSRRTTPSASRAQSISSVTSRDAYGSRKAEYFAQPPAPAVPVRTRRCVPCRRPTRPASCRRHLTGRPPDVSAERREGDRARPEARAGRARSLRLTTVALIAAVLANSFFPSSAFP